MVISLEERRRARAARRRRGRLPSPGKVLVALSFGAALCAVLLLLTSLTALATSRGAVGIIGITAVASIVMWPRAGRWISRGQTPDQVT
ncbi:MAG: hypothetical protein WDA27_11280 [Actinomycetota bacterium]